VRRLHGLGADGRASPARCPPAIGTDAFQECDTVGITRSVTKHNELVTEAQDIPLAIRQAFHIATTGRPGPVLSTSRRTSSTPPTRAAMEWYWPTDDEVAASLPGLPTDHEGPSPRRSRRPPS
jgi:acetolactate synthase-1/2/3 large subunit